MKIFHAFGQRLDFLLHADAQVKNLFDQNGIVSM
jgi:hypothetical protein